MAESFLLVVPPGWTQLDWAYITGNTELSVANVPNWINANMLDYIELPLKDAGLLPAESAVVEARLFDDTFFMVRLG